MYQRLCQGSLPVSPDSTFSVFIASSTGLPFLGRRRWLFWPTSYSGWCLAYIWHGRLTPPLAFLKVPGRPRVSIGLPLGGLPNIAFHTKPNGIAYLLGHCLYNLRRALDSQVAGVTSSNSDPIKNSLLRKVFFVQDSAVLVPGHLFQDSGKARPP